MELSNEADFTRILQLEENYIKEICDNIIALKPTLVFTEKGISDLAQHFLAKAGITGKPLLFIALYSYFFLLIYSLIQQVQLD